MRISTISHDEKNIFEHAVTPTQTISASNVTRFISEKLLVWGVEERGAYCTILTSQLVDPNQRTIGLVCLPLDRYTPRRHRGENRNAFHQDIFRMAVCKYEHLVVRLPFLLNYYAGNSGSHDSAFRRFASGTLGPVTFGLGLRDSCLIILFFNLICAIPPAYL
jgi:hypothetical protein